MCAAYLGWRETAANCRAAYRDWLKSAARETDLGFASFVAALHQEQSAAASYAAIVEDAPRALAG